jgi:hypothetical protein
MTDIDQTARIVRLARQAGLGHIDLTAAAEAVLRSGAIDQAVDAVVVDRLFAHVGRTGAAPVDPWQAFCAKQGVPTDFAGVDVAKRVRLRAEFQRQQSEQSAPSPQARFEAEMLGKHGTDWRTMLTPEQKMRFAGVSGENPNTRFTSGTQSQERRDLDHLRAKLSTARGMDQVHISNMIQNLELRIGVAS